LSLVPAGALLAQKVSVPARGPPPSFGSSITQTSISTV
jgi:hypothetical protein